MNTRTGKPSHGSPGAGKGAGSQRATHWGDVAEWYDALVGDEGSEYQREVIIPGVMRMLNIKGVSKEEHAEGMSVLDLACGQGVLCRKLARAGCKVTGLDAAEALIGAARARNEGEGLAIRYVMADATKLVNEKGVLQAGLQAGSVEAVTLILAVQNISPLSPMWQGVKAVLKPGGKLVMVMIHPAFRIPRRSDWLWEPQVEGGAQARVVRRYLSSEKIEIQTHPGRAAHGTSAEATVHFHRPLQAYINTMASAGLLVDHMEEWPSHKKDQPGPRKAALEAARKEFPLFMALRAVKVG